MPSQKLTVSGSDRAGAPSAIAEARLSAFSALGCRLSAAQTAKEAAEIILAVAEQLLGLDACTLDLYSPEKDRLYHVLNRDTINGRRVDYPGTYHDTPPSPCVRRTIESGGQLILKEEPRAMLPDATSFGDTSRPSASIMLVPVRDGSKVIGVLSIHSYTPRAYDQQSLETLQALADHCGGALQRIRAQEALSESEANYRLLVQHSPDATFLHSEGRFVLANPATLKLFRAELPEQLLGKSVMDVVPPENRALIRQRIQRTVEGETTPLLEQRVLRLDGTSVEVEVTGVPFIYRGKPAVQTVMREITERKRAEARLAAFSALGHRLSAAQTAKAAARIIVEVADQLLGWDACMCDLYSPEERLMTSLLDMDVLEGQRTECSPIISRVPLSVTARRAIEEGGQLILRGQPGELQPDSLPFGDAGRRSASLMFVPIRNGTNVIGVLSIQSYTPNAYNQQSLEMLQVLADHCGGALDRLRSEGALKERARLAELTTNVGLSLIGRNSLPEMLRLCCEAVVRQLNGAFARIWTLNLEENVLELQASAGLYTHLDGPQAKVPVGEYKIGLIARERKPHVTNEVQTDPAFRDREWAQAEGMVGFAGYPLLIGDQLLGVMAMVARQPLTEFALTGLAAIANQIALGIERKRVEEELRWKTAFLEAQVNSSLDGILVVDNRGKKVLQNQRTIDLWKIPPQIAADSDDTKQVAFVAGATTNPSLFIERVSHLMAHPTEISRDEVELTNGTLLDRYSSPVVGKDGTHYGRIWTFRDITEHRKLEAKFRQAQKMEAIGQLAGGVAHDFNNLLSVIRGNSELLLMDATQFSGQTVDCLHQVVAAADRAAGLTRQLLAFGRKQMLQTQPLNLTDVVGNLTKMLKRIIGEHIDLQLGYAGRLAFVQADVGMIEQVLVNLVVNARDAMPHGGRLVIATEPVRFEGADLPEHPEARAGEFVCLSVTDTGTGIAPEHLPRIFEPFFTTKDVGKGSGLGLATVYGILKQHQGWIEVSSRLGSGSTFRIFLPAIPPPAGTPVPPPAEPDLPRGTEKILLVEDDDLVRRITRRVLELHGYKIYEAPSARAALELWRTHGDEIALLLSDIVMPQGVTGRELAEQLCAQRPALKVIFLSGYSADASGKDTAFFQRSGSYFLPKPGSSRTLLETVRRCLDGK